MTKKLKTFSKFTFKSERFEMRTFTSKDFAAWKRAMLLMKKKQNEFDDAVIAPRKVTKELFQKMVTRRRKNCAKDLIYCYGIFERNHGTLVGEVHFSLVHRFNVQSARISYGVFNNYWRQGIGSEVVNAAVLFAFKKLKLHRLEAEIEPTNRASIALAKSTGFIREGLRRKSVYFNRQWNDHVVYSILPEDIGLKNVRPTIC